MITDNLELLSDIHLGLSPPTDVDDIITCDRYIYYHYGCDGLNDSGWGCGYRTLQTMCSWIRGSKGDNLNVPPVPSIPQIQKTLVSMGDKSEGFCGSREWIGSVEVGLVIDKLYDVPCKILHIQSGSELVHHIPELERHFTVRKSPIMMGGESDNSSKGIIGIAKSSKTSQCFLLILDPHYLFTADEAQPISASSLQNQGWISWRDISTLHQNTFYNLCLPQT